jgi:thioredoxin reductase
VGELARPFPPGEYGVVVVGSGPGALQTSYFLRRLGVDHAVISEDDVAGGMFCRFPIFERLLSWTKPEAPDEDPRDYELHDQNSLIAEEPELHGLVRRFIEGGSDLPSRTAMEAALQAFAEQAPIDVRYGCRWEGTRRDGDGLVLETSDGEYRCRAAVFAIGVTEPWLPALAGIEHASHYVDVRPEAGAYRGRRVCIIGKRNSGFEVGRALLGDVRELTLVSPRPVELQFARAPVRSQYLQPFDEDARGASVTRVFDAAVDGVERGTGGGLQVRITGTARSEALSIDADDVIAATGFATPLGDLPALGLATVADGRLPALTAFWESVSLPGAFFAGSAMQASRGIGKRGVSSTSAMIVGFRYNARVLARHLAERLSGTQLDRPKIEQDRLLPYLLSELTRAPELRMQKGYLTRAVTIDPRHGIRDDGIVPLEHFLDDVSSDGVAVTLELDAEASIQPVVYARSGGRVRDVALEPNLARNYEGPRYREELELLLRPLLPV